MLNGVIILYTVCAKVNQDLFNVTFVEANTFIVEKIFAGNYWDLFCRELLGSIKGNF